MCASSNPSQGSVLYEIYAAVGISSVFVMQLTAASEQVHSLQQQLKYNANQGTAQSLDMARLQNKVEGLQFDLGNLTQSLQVVHQVGLSTAGVIASLQCHTLLCIAPYCCCCHNAP